MERLRDIYEWLVRAHPALTEPDEQRTARLFAAIILIQIGVTMLGILGMELFYHIRADRSIWRDLDTWGVAAQLFVGACAYLILRGGRYRAGIGLYIASVAGVALTAPFLPDPNAQIGILSAAAIPILLAAMVFRPAQVMAVAAAILLAGTALVSAVPIPTSKAGSGLVLLIVVAIISGLALAFRYHLTATERDRLSELARSEMRYRSLFDRIADGIFISDRSGRFVEVNPAACRHLGYSRDELLGMSVREISTRTDVDFDRILQGLEREGHLAYRTVHRRKDGSTLPVELVLSLVERNGETRIMGMARDISGHEAEISFREAVIARASEGLCVCHQTSDPPYLSFTVWNDRMTEITGYTRQEINESGWYQTVYTDPQVRERAVARMARMREGEDLKAEEWTITRRDGERRTLEISTTIIQAKDGAVHVLALMHDVTKRRQAEEALVKSEKRYRDMFDSVMEGIALVDEHEIITFANPAFARMFGFGSVSALVGRNLSDFIATESKETLQRETAKRIEGLSSQYEFDIITAGGEPRTLYASITPHFRADGSYAGGLGAVVDITERKRAEQLQKETQQKLEQAERFESLGVMAGGVAHDLNNMLGPVAGYAELLLKELPPESKPAGRAQKIMSAAYRAADVVQDLLTLARRGRYQMSSVVLNDVIAAYFESPEFSDLRRRHPDVQFELKLCSALQPIEGSQAHLTKVMMNLVTNAAEAMPGGGPLRIITEQRRLERLLGGFDRIQPGEYVLVRVRDTGVGIDRSDLDRIFEPYFSKKVMGRSGSGLGLSVVYGVVKDHHGYYDIFSELGHGTEFVLYFPVGAVDQTVARPDDALKGGTETILVVDDQLEQREIAGEVLATLGYRVHTAEHGHAAVEFLRGRPVDVVVMDMIMEPGFDGLDTWREIKKMRPELPCVIVSGFSATERVMEMQRMGAGPYVRKPYSMEGINKALREALNRARTPAAAPK